MKGLASQVTPGSVAVVVRDGAGWHRRGEGTIVPENVRLLSLPPYSPEPNPLERVRDTLRQNKLSARILGTYGDIVEACREVRIASRRSGPVWRFAKVRDNSRRQG